ncbi:MAG: STAS domain-containing protein [Clostridiaceae bacterium]|mgnify:FL=1|jgi:anti-sigma B factor antagonist|nr:STAS domain-containing protein [Clostridiaceae bacterium]HZJ91112.1 STAS domain-containing protein [Oscillospiraceae bacterium]
MEIRRTIGEDTITIEVEGRLDTVTSSQLEQEVSEVFEEEKSNIVFDFTSLEYISSAGLRVLLASQKQVNSLGTEMRIVGANDVVKEIFEITGFSDIMQID